MAEQTRSRAQGEEPEQDSQEYQRLREKLAGCIRTGEITLSSGKVTDFYFDGRLVSLDPEGSVLLGGLMLEALLARGITAVGGLTSGADPLTSSIGVLAWQRQVPMNLFFVRKERKEQIKTTSREFTLMFSGVDKALFDEIRRRLMKGSKWEYQTADFKQRVVYVNYEGNPDMLSDMVQMYLEGAEIDIGVGEFSAGRNKIIFGQ